MLNPLLPYLERPARDIIVVSNVPCKASNIDNEKMLG